MKKMKSIQTKLMVLILSGILLASVIIGGTGMLTARRVIDNDSAVIMNILCRQSASDLENILGQIAQSVDMLAAYAQDRLESPQALQDAAYRKSYTQEMQRIMINAANNTQGAVAFYLRYNPEFTPPTSGLFWSKETLRGDFKAMVPTDLSSCDPGDTEHVGWYYIPVETGKPLWMEPYMNKNIDIYMISYVVPIYKDNTVVGVVGMDINFDVIIRMINDISVYEKGYAFLTNREGHIMYHHDVPNGTDIGVLDDSLEAIVEKLELESSQNKLYTYEYNDVAMEMAFSRLSNGMNLIVTAPSAEINEESNRLIYQIVIATIIIAVFFVTLTILLAHTLIRPLKELTIAARKIADGDLTVPIEHRGTDEVGILADSFRMTVHHLQKHMDYINGLAYRDTLTGVKNKAAYLEMEKRINQQIKLGRPEFAVMVLDLNGLKLVNDNYGHDAGDILIINATRIICNTFSRSPVYRIGGDEFVVLLENVDYQNYKCLSEEFDRAIQEANKLVHKEHDKVSVARGIAIYSEMVDTSFASVFKRADQAMYRNKAQMKEKGVSESMLK